MAKRRESSKLAPIATAVVFITLIGKLMGLIREAYIASAYGASYIADIYVLQNGIVNAICTILLCVVTTTFIPLAFDARDEGRERSFISNVLLGFTVFAICLSAALVFIPELVLRCVAPGILEKYTGETLRIILWSIQISMVNIVLLMIQGLLRALLQLNDKMQIASTQGIILNVILIGYLAFFADCGLIGLSVSMVLAQCIIDALFFIYVFKKKMLIITRARVSNIIKDCKSMLMLALPVLLMSLLSQASYLVDRTIASGFDEGTMAMIGYATTIGIAINGIFGESINSVIYPRISEMAAEKRRDELSEFGITVALIASIPIAAIIGGIVPSANCVVSIIYEHGSFSTESVGITSLFLAFYMPGMLFYYERDFLNRFCYALKKTKLPSLCAAFGFILTILLNLTIPQFLGAKGIVLATTIASSATFLLQLLMMAKLHYLSHRTTWIKCYATIVVAFFASVFATWQIIASADLSNHILIVIVSIALSGMLYCLILGVLNVKAIAKFIKEKK